MISKVKKKFHTRQKNSIIGIKKFKTLNGSFEKNLI